MKKNEINVFDVANYIIINSKNDASLTHMKLHKLIYYAYIKYLLKYNRSLINDNPQAWLYGPIFGKLYLVLKAYYEKNIKKPLINGKIKKIDIKSKVIIDEVLNLCKNFDGYELVDISQRQVPWIKIYQNRYENNNNIIPDSLLKTYFSKNNLLE
ncbi:Panacea domain-containing protein [Candidatus Phytoplasma pyri]|uniref:Panacea domain-containing protein n=1 Tax=Candidatus Phytoplasma pyri TaxID=47566 RepID=UPI0039838251